MATIRRSPSGPFEAIEPGGALPETIVIPVHNLEFGDETVLEREYTDPAFESDEVEDVTRGVLAFFVREPGSPGPQGAGGNARGFGIVGAFVKNVLTGTVCVRFVGEPGAEYEDVNIGVMLLPRVEATRGELEEEEG